MPTAIVTGGAQGIGKGIVQHLLVEGWQVAAFDSDTEALRDLKQENPHPALLSVRVDVAKEKDVAKGMEKVKQWVGNSVLDLLVSNAGLADPISGPFEQLDLKRWQKWQDSHVTGAFLVVRAAIPLLRPAKGSIVMMASTRALQSEPNCEAYATAKGGLCALTHALAVSLGPDIRVNAVLPGWIETRPWRKASARKDVDHSDMDKMQHPVGRVGSPPDIARTVSFLASKDAGFITGQQIIVDGGMSRKMIYAE